MANAMGEDNFQPPHLGNCLTDFDEIQTLELPAEDHPPCKISFRSNDVGGLSEYPVFHCQVSFSVFFGLSHAHRSHQWIDFDDLYVL